MKKQICKLLRRRTWSSGFFLVLFLVICLTVFPWAVSVAVDAPNSNAIGSSNPAGTEKDSRISPTQTGRDNKKLNGEERQEWLPRGNRVPYPIITSESDRAIRGIRRGQVYFDRSMRNLNDSLRRTNDAINAINRIRSLNRKF